MQESPNLLANGAEAMVVNVVKVQNVEKVLSAVRHTSTAL